MTPRVATKRATYAAFRPESHVRAEARPVTAPRTDAARWLWVAGLVAILGTAAALRVWDLGRIGFGSDEAVYTGQAAALAGADPFTRLFSAFRAHPLLVQGVLALQIKAFGVSDEVARAIVALGFGVTGIAATMLLARRAYGAVVAVIAGAFLAIAPYHVIVSRQVLLDLALALFVTLAFWSAYRFASSERAPWLYLTAVFVGLAILAKEVAVLMLPALGLFFLWSGRRRILRFRSLVVAGALLGLVVAPFALTRFIGPSESSSGYVAYQLFREPNHPWWYFPVVLWQSMSPPLVIASLIGVGVMATRRALADKLLLSWLAVFALFFQVWPTKLFPYLVAVVPVLVIAAAIAATAIAREIAHRVSARAARGILGVLVAGVGAPMLAWSMTIATQGIERIEGPAGSVIEVQDFAGGREAASWALEHTPEGSVFMTIGPSMGNLLSFYGNRDWYAVSVSHDPTKRNPAYRPIANPDLEIRELRVHYAVWDAYSAARSSFYEERLMRYVRKFSGTPVLFVWMGEDHRAEAGATPPEGADVRLVVYDLVGGDPLSGASA